MILVFSLLIIVHELGHFISAKLSKVQVNEFWLGMGPTILKKHYKGTDYCLKAFPFGGAVVMEGEDAESESENSFAKAKKLNKAIIMAAGSFMNFLLGFFIVFILFIPLKTADTTVISNFEQGFKYETQSGLKPKDEILEIDGYRTYFTSDISQQLAKNQTGTYDILVKRDNKDVLIENYELKADTFTIDGKEVVRYGLNFESKDLSFLGKLDYSLKTSVNYGRMVWDGIKELFTGKVSVSDLSGPVGISMMIGEAYKVSAASMWSFVAFISINLGIMNLLPLPALDGGRLIFLLIETIRKKPVSQKVEGAIHGAGLIILLGLMVYVTFNDIFLRLLK